LSPSGGVAYSRWSSGRSSSPSVVVRLSSMVFLGVVARNAMVSVLRPP
jgi:hypothetical protein